MEGECLGYPGAFIVASQLLDGILPPMAGKSPQPSHEPPIKAPVTLMKQWGWGTDAKATAPQTAAQTLNEELKDPSSVQSFHLPCEPALMGLTAGCR